MVRRGDHHGVNLFPLQEIAEIVEDQRFLLVGACDDLRREIRAVAIDVADGGDLHSRVRGQEPQVMIAPAHADADQPGQHTVARRKAPLGPRHAGRRSRGERPSR